MTRRGNRYPRRLWAIALLVAACQTPAASAPKQSPAQTAANRELWTCGMHPQVIEGHTGVCPICNMELTPATNSAPVAKGITVIDPVVVQNMGMRVATVIEGRLTRVVRLAGRVTRAQADHSGSGARLRVEAEAFQHQLGFLRSGQPARARFSAAPGHRFDGRVSSIASQLDPLSGTATVQIDVDDPRNLLPGMHGSVEVITVSDDETLLVPREAIIDTGTRQIAFVVRQPGQFEPRELHVGAVAEERAQVLSGLAKGETVVVSGQFLVDSESRLQQAIEKYQAGAWSPKLKPKPAEH